MKVAIVHEHLTQDGGAERVVLRLKEIFPDAPIYVLVYDRDKVHEKYHDYEVHTSFLQRLPLGIKKYQWYLPLMPAAMEKFDLSGYDIVISSCSMFAKGVLTTSDTLHLCYLYTPTRYLWNYAHQYHRELRHPKWVRKIIPFYLTFQRIWDRLAAERVDEYACISRSIQKAARKFYRRDCELIYPPVDVNKFSICPFEKRGEYYLMLGRLVAYKRYDLVVKAFNKLGWPLKIVGRGPEANYLRKIAGPNVEIIGRRVSERELIDLFERCQAFVFPAEEDFGIVPVEAMSAGRPVLAYGKGGALDYINPGITGELFYEQSEESLIEALRKFHPEKYDPLVIRRHAEKFSAERFKAEFKAFVDRAWRKHEAERIVTINK